MSKRPNILLITTDQQRFDTINALGNGSIWTPHLNWLVRAGITYTQCRSLCPVCMPARATIMTGLEAEHHGALGNDGSMPLAHRPTLPQLLGENGYQTCAEGKMHFEPIRACYGFQRMELPMDYFRAQRRTGQPHTRRHGVGENEQAPYINSTGEENDLTHWIVERSMDFLETRDPTRPFFLWTSFTKPHAPLDPALPYWQLYAGKALPPAVQGDWTGKEHALGFYRPTWMLSDLEYLSDAQRQDWRRAYYACVTQIDYQLGLLFARLRELDLLQNTWIIFTSDHGDMLGDHGMAAKSVHLEGSCHVPLLIKPPAAFGAGHPLAGKTDDRDATLADILPTVLNLCGIACPRPVDGRDLLADAGPDRTLFGDCENRYFMLLRGGYKYLRSTVNGSELLFDLRGDPRETHDLSADPAFAALKRGLSAALTAQITSIAPELVQEGSLVITECIASSRDVAAFPGLNTTLFPRDTIH